MANANHVLQSAKIKTGSLWSKNKEDLTKQLVDLKTELGQLRTQKIAGGNQSKLTKMYGYPRASSYYLSSPQVLTAFKPRPPEIYRTGPNRHQPQPALSTTPFLQGKEIPTPRSSPKTDPRHQKAINEG